MSEKLAVVRRSGHEAYGPFGLKEAEAWAEAARRKDGANTWTVIPVVGKRY